MRARLPKPSEFLSGGDSLACVADAIRVGWRASWPADPAPAPSAFDLAVQALEHAGPKPPILLRRVIPAVLDELGRAGDSSAPLS